MDFNCNFGKNLSKEIKIQKQEEKPEKEKSEEIKKDEPSPNIKIPANKRITADSSAINAMINRALAEGNKPPVVEEKEKTQKQSINESGNNPFAAVNAAEEITDVEETANNIFNGVTGNAIEKDQAVVLDSAGQTIRDYQYLVDLWNSNDLTSMSYETKLGKISDIIAAAENEGKTEEAATWRCYRFILRNNYLKEQYNGYLQQLASGTNYEDLGWNEQPWEISAYFSPDDYEDWEVFHLQCHFGGYTDPDGLNYVQPEPAEYEQAYIYCNAMIARYSTKILAIQVKLQDPDLENNHVLTEKLNKDIAYYRQLLNGMIAERNRLAKELKYGYFDESGNGAFHFTVPNGGLVQGLTPPENTPPVNNQPDLKLQFEALEEQYEATYGNNVLDNNPQQIAMVNELIAFANKMVLKQEDPVDYWQERLRHWQNVLEQLQNGN